MKPVDIVTNEMLTVAKQAYNRVAGGIAYDHGMRAALIAVVPLFGDRLAKIADAEAKRASDASTKSGQDGRKDAMYQANNAYHAAWNIASAIRSATKG